MPSQSTHIYSVGGLTGPVPFTQVIRSLIATPNDEHSRSASFKDTAFLDDRSSPERIAGLITDLTSLAER